MPWSKLGSEEAFLNSRIGQDHRARERYRPPRPEPAGRSRASVRPSYPGRGPWGHGDGCPPGVDGLPGAAFNRSPEDHADQLAGSIELVAPIWPTCHKGVRRCRRPTDLEEAVAGVDVLMVCTPATGHRFMAQRCARLLTDGQIIVLNPGRTGGAGSSRLREEGARCDRRRAQTFIYAARMLNPARAHLPGEEQHPVAALPYRRQGRRPHRLPAVRARR